MELVIKEPYIEIFEKILKLFTSICENLHFRLTQNKLQLSGSNGLTNELIIYIDKKFFMLNEINVDIKNINGTVNAKDFYNCIYSHKIVKQFKNNGYYSYNKKSNDINLIKNYDKEENYQGKNKKCNLNISKLILKFNKEKLNILEIVIKFKKCNTYFSAVLKLRSFNTPLKNYIYKNESIIQVEPTLFLLNLKDLANERNIFLKNTDNSFVISSLETSEFSLNKEKVKREQFFYNNKFIAIPSCKTKYFFKNKKFEDHSMSLPLNELKNIIKFCSDLNLLCLFSTKNFKENLVIYFGRIITQILENNRKRITNIKNKKIYDDKYYYKDNNSEKSSYVNFKEEYSNSFVFYLSDDNSSDEYDSSYEGIDTDIYLPDNYETNSVSSRNFNDIITGCVHFTSYFNISCNFKGLEYSDIKASNDFQDIYFNQQNNFFEEKDLIIKQDKKLKKGVQQESFFNSEFGRSNIDAFNNLNNEKNELRNETNKKFNINQNDYIQNFKNDSIHNISNIMKNHLNEQYNDFNYNFKFSKDNKKNILSEKEYDQLIHNNNKSRESNRDKLMINSKNKECFYTKNVIDNNDIYNMNDYKKRIRNNKNNKCEEYDYNKKMSNNNDSTSEKYEYDKTISNDNNNKYEYDKNVSNDNNNKYEIYKKKISNNNDNTCDKYKYDKNLENNNNDEYEKYDNDKFIRGIQFEELNYDKFIRGNINISDAHMNIKMKINELNSTFENLKNIDKYKKNYFLSKKLNNYSEMCSDSNVFKNINKRKNVVENSQIRKRNKHFSNDIYKDLKKKSNNSLESISEYNSMLSDSFYSLSEDTEVENNSRYDNIEYFDYFSNLYSKYNIYNNNMKKWEENSDENSLKQNFPLENGDQTYSKLPLLNYNKNTKFKRLNTNSNDTIIKTSERNINNLKHNNKISSYYTHCKFKKKKDYI
ncbi:conserved Plasmodium protein, unknown function [Plasmodium relictum]|uniref:Uncharacterized protein n=1 Tax=Plasmodium relictum TaxID=85471 RepID=A0A1J1H6R5_PLARL|nr:conserved Plasmodium protein, unknown function [Plasmodium relictum]CRG99125.1 conserved Plasmodium protein, unknown function [Plasmodium relictum]